MGSLGWPFKPAGDFPGAEVDPLFNSNHVRDLYFKADPDYSGRCVHERQLIVRFNPLSLLLLCTFRFTVPALWDKKLNTIVNNESSEIIRMFNTAFNDQLPADKAALDLYPANLRPEIDELNEWVYDTVNSE